MYSYICSTPGLLRLAIIFSQLSVWVSLALLIKFFCAEDCIGGTFFNVRIAYLIFSTSGFLLSFVVYLMGIYKVLPSDLFIIITDFLWIIATFILAICAAIQESIFGGNEVLNSIILNQGAYAAAAAFGFLTSILLAVDGFYHVCRNRPETTPRDIESNNTVARSSRASNKDDNRL